MRNALNRTPASTRTACRKFGVAIVASAVCLIAAPALTDVSRGGFHLQGQFVESAPRDSFVFSNQSGEEWNIVSIQVDLAQSAGKLIFDTTDGGEGVEVFQPFAVADSRNGVIAAQLSEMPITSDGDREITLSFSNFPKDAKFSFTIDVDDQLADSDLGQIRVSGGEIAGSVLNVTAQTANAEYVTMQGVYGSDGQASVTSMDF